jgi:hypothetical protein
MLKTTLILSLWIISSCSSTAKKIDCYSSLLQSQEAPQVEEEVEEATWSATIYIGSDEKTDNVEDIRSMYLADSFQYTPVEVELERKEKEILPLYTQDNTNHAVLSAILCVAALLLIYQIAKKGHV